MRLIDMLNEGFGGLLGDDMGLGKTIQVISFLSAIMRKHGDERDQDRRRRYVSDLQDEEPYGKNGTLPSANAKWPTCLIVAVCPTLSFVAHSTITLVYPKAFDCCWQLGERVRDGMKRR